MPSLFDPIQLGAIDAPNRILMAPLTRGRAAPGFVPTEMKAEYYGQRAGAGLIIAEATGISVQGLGWPAAPGVWSEEQTEGWKLATKAVHDNGGRIILQLWHMGRIVHSDFLDGEKPISASATTAPGEAYTPTGKKPYVEARALAVEEVPGLLDDYRKATANAMAAGFDGVQIHAANGYLIDQFLRDGTNLRDDEYGGSPDNRTRLLHEVAQAVAEEAGADWTAVRLSPNGDSQGTNDSDPGSVFPLAAQKLADVGIAFLELREPGPEGTFGNTDVPKLSPEIRKVFKAPLVLNSDYTKESGQAALDSGIADAISYGRPFISNPDLVRRFREDIPLNGVAEGKGPWDFSPTWYSNGPEGYVDYPVAEENVAAE
ncbi:MAG: alkene reductase [Parasphingopyxis sp.]|uniref:alkene reductase n=1 Tax=Parasphingopyxis sp. TaxID=1920299 RepID=UPI0032EB45AC